MKKVLTTILTAGLAFAMISTSGTAYAEDFKESDTIPQSKNSEATVTFQSPVDGLTLGSVSNIAFGIIEISNEEFDIPSTDSSSLTVSDFRGTFEGWHVTAALSNFSNTARGETDSLQAAELKLVGNNVESSVDATKELTDTVITSGDESGALAVVNAPNGTGTGVSIANWSSANLTVPNSVLAIASEGTHEATITWTLDDAPQ